ncbi:hypothetical protein C0995_006127 [Termitomyces sp. Mi166|nr:hypothetical protein C0995_006127 [Termitomyces sp. Mi166\
MWRMHKKETWCTEFKKTVKHAICTEEQVRLMHFAKLASEMEAIESNPVVSGSGFKAPLSTVAVEEHQLYDDLNKNNKAQALLALPPLSKGPSA